MKRSRFTETQIVAILVEADAGMAVTEVCRKHGIAGNTFYNWKKKYAGMGVSDVRRLKELDYYKNRKEFCNCLEENIEDTLTIFNLPPEHRRRLRTTNGVERMHEEVKRRTIPVRIFPNRDSTLRLIGSIWQKVHEKWITGKRYLNMEALQVWEEEQEKKEVETISMEC